MRARSSAPSVQGVSWCINLNFEGHILIDHLSSSNLLQSASTVVGALGARSAVGDQYASTVVGAIYARSAEGHKYASTVVYALSARSAVGDQSASTVVSAIIARNAVEREYASMVVGAESARSAVHSRLLLVQSEPFNAARCHRCRNRLISRVSFSLTLS